MAVDAAPRRTGTGTNQEGVRRHNLATMLRQVHLGGTTSRAELTAAMGLNRSTIGGLVTELSSLGLVTVGTAPAGPGGARAAGRPSPRVTLAEAGPYVVAVDLGVGQVVVARVGLGGVVHERVRGPVDPTAEAWQVGAGIAALVRRVVRGAPPGAPLAGIGMAVPGLVRRSDGLVRLAPNLGWVDVSPGSIILAALGVDVPVSLANDADLGALAEHGRGVGVGVDDLIFVSGNVGVGAGVVAGGQRLEGAGGYAGEVGHMVFDPEGRDCHCGNRGCFETEVGASAIAEAIGCPADAVASLGEVLDGYDTPPPALHHIGRQLGEGLSGIVNAFNPRVVVLGGYFRALHRLVPADITAGIQARTLPAPLESLVLAPPALGADSILLGAAEMALEPLLADPVAGLQSSLAEASVRLAG